MKARAVAVLGAWIAVAWSAQAAAFCREVTVSPPANYNPGAQGCFGGDGNALPPLFWKNQCVGYSIQRGASKWVSQADAASVAAGAFAAWSAASCTGGGAPSILATEFPPVSCDVVPSQEHNNPIIFRDDGWPYGDASNTLGYTTLTVDLESGEILGAAIEINSADNRIVANAPAPAGAYDLASILTHEAGHFFGLAHSDNSGAVMYAFYKPGSTALSADDTAGICAIYPANGSRTTKAGEVASATCNPEPPEGFLDACGSIDAGASVGSGGSPSPPARSADAGPPAPCAYRLLSCTLGRAPASRGSGGFASCALAIWVFCARRARRAARASQACSSYFFIFS